MYCSHYQSYLQWYGQETRCEGENNPEAVKKLREAIAHVSLPCFFSNKNHAYILKIHSSISFYPSGGVFPKFQELFHAEMCPDGIEHMPPTQYLLCVQIHSYNSIHLCFVASHHYCKQDCWAAGIYKTQKKIDCCFHAAWQQHPSDRNTCNASINEDTPQSGKVYHGPTGLSQGGWNARFLYIVWHCELHWWRQNHFQVQKSSPSGIWIEFTTQMLALLSWSWSTQRQCKITSLLSR